MRLKKLPHRNSDQTIATVDLYSKTFFQTNFILRSTSDVIIHCCQKATRVSVCMWEGAGA